MTEEKQDNLDQEEETPLFRKEALDAKKGSSFGKTLIIAPVSFSIWTLAIGTITLIICLYLYFGEYSKRQTVLGILIPDKGIMAVYAKNHGVVVKRFVEHGEKVQKGQLLYLISTEQESSGDQSINAQQIEILEKQIAMFEKNMAGYENLLKQHYISEEQYQRRQHEYLSIKKELNRMKSETDYAIRAPEGGIVSALISVVGDRVTEMSNLCSIIPNGSNLEGELFVPTSKAGFIKIGQKVLIKYHAYPYQRFGLYEAIVSKIDKSVINPNDNSFRAPFRMEEAFYRITVKLQQQTVTVYGQPYPLTPGMTLDGVILGEKRKIWQWVFEPIYSLRGTL